MSTNKFQQLGSIFDFRNGSTISSAYDFTKYLCFKCSLIRSIADLALKTSNRTIPNEYTSDFSVKSPVAAYSGSLYPHVDITLELTLINDFDMLYGPLLDKNNPEIFGSQL
ncbi:hypothetical protein AAHE18_12G079800 [Arachis hypogaea]